jgi:hypothetical protein
MAARVTIGSHMRFFGSRCGLKDVDLSAKTLGTPRVQQVDTQGGANMPIFCNRYFLISPIPRMRAKRRVLLESQSSGTACKRRPKPCVGECGILCPVNPQSLCCLASTTLVW